MNVNTRVYTACEECRRRKARCDTARPACSRCAKKGIACVVKQRSQRRPSVKRSDFEALSQEVQRLREQLARQNHKLPDTPSYSDEEDKESDSDYPLDMMHYSSDIYNTVTRGYHRLASDGELQSVLETLDRDEFVALLENYWQFYNVHTMIVWRSLFVSDLCANFGGKFSSKSLLLAMLALGSTNTESLEDLGPLFFEATKRALHTELEAPQVSSVQTLQLLCIFCHSQGDTTGALRFDKSAVDLALRLGVNQTQDSGEDTILKKFVWWGCYQIDMLSRFSVGRPQAIKRSETNTNPPQLSESEYTMGLETDDSYREFSFAYTFNLELFVTVGDSLSKLFSADSDDRLIDSPLTDLKTFRDSLPDWVVSGTSPQIYVFHMRVHYFTILLSGQFISPETDSLTGERKARLQSCIQSATEVIQLLKRYEIAYGLHSLDTFVTDLMVLALCVLLCALKFKTGDYRGDVEELMRIIRAKDAQRRLQKRIELLIEDWDAYGSVSY